MICARGHVHVLSMSVQMLLASTSMAESDFTPSVQTRAFHNMISARCPSSQLTLQPFLLHEPTFDAFCN